jgi:sodium pump decarboxylase gamma subunit
MKRKLFLALVIALTACSSLLAQGRKSIRINEVMVQNTENAVDDYGCHSAWIELFNGNFAPQNICGMFLTDDPQNPTKYPVPLGDSNTEIPRREHVVFWADGEPTRGTFHLNFTLNPGVDNTVYLYDADGITLIDQVTIPAALGENESYARISDGADTWQVRDNSSDELYVTPSSANVIKGPNPNINKFRTIDGHGFGMTVMAMGVVFTALLVLCICFYIISKIGAGAQRARKMLAHGVKTSAAAEDVPAAVAATDSGEEIAAIAMALYEHLNVHDTENTILTINKVKRAYSPWSSKIYSMRQTPSKH